MTPSSEKASRIESIVFYLFFCGMFSATGVVFAFLAAGVLESFGLGFALSTYYSMVKPVLSALGAKNLGADLIQLYALTIGGASAGALSGTYFLRAYWSEGIEPNQSMDRTETANGLTKSTQ